MADVYKQTEFEIPNLHKALNVACYFIMTPLSENIYYLDNKLIDKIQNEFILIAEKGWYELHQNKNDKSFWRLDKFDKLQQQCFVKLSSNDNWENFNDKDFRIELLAKSRGLSDKNCIWKNCNDQSLNELVFCSRHAYEEMGIRK